MTKKQPIEPFKTLNQAAAAIQALAPDQIEIDTDEKRNKLHICLKYFPYDIKHILEKTLPVDTVAEVIKALQARNTIKGDLSLEKALYNLSPAQFELELSERQAVVVTFLTRKYVRKLVKQLQAQIAVKKAQFQQIGVDLQTENTFAAYQLEWAINQLKPNSLASRADNLKCAFRNITDAKKDFKKIVEDAEQKFLRSGRASEFVEFELVEVTPEDLEAMQDD